MDKTYYAEEREGLIRDTGMGLIHVAYGQGVGKTSRCIGLAVRAAGAGFKVHWIQFMKSGTASEAIILSQLAGVSFKCPGKHPFILSQGPNSIHYEHAESALWFAKQSVKEGADLVICDEILNTLIFKVLDLYHILDLMNRCRGQAELIMSGADAHPAIIARADYVTKFVQEKHPYYRGHIARRGIEY
ncbi:MAG: cob(I)yrinic acid a,c-diamide adenosyltransferase [Desulfarculaceae bacterium]